MSIAAARVSESLATPALLWAYRRLILDADPPEPHLEFLQHGVGEQPFHFFREHHTKVRALVTRMAAFLSDPVDLGGSLVVAETVGERGEHEIRHVLLHALDGRALVGVL